MYPVFTACSGSIIPLSDIIFWKFSLDIFMLLIVYVFPEEMFFPVTDDTLKQVFLHLAQVGLHPLLALWFHLLELVELNFVLPCEYVLLLDIVLIWEFIIPKFAPRKASVSE